MNLHDANHREQSLGELWQSLDKLTAHIHTDNQEYADGDYPLVMRTMQLESIKVLVTSIEKHHNQ